MVKSDFKAQTDALWVYCIYSTIQLISILFMPLLEVLFMFLSGCTIIQKFGVSKIYFFMFWGEKYTQSCIYFIKNTKSNTEHYYI